MTSSKWMGALVLSVTATMAAPHAWAKPGFAIVTLSPATFVSNCQSMGGTTSTAPGGGIRCTLSSGQTVDCSFNTTAGTAVCQWSKDLPPKSRKPLIGDPAPGTMNPDTGTMQPKATGTPSTVN